MIRHPYGPDELDRTDPELDGIAEQLQDYSAGQSSGPPHRPRGADPCRHRRRAGSGRRVVGANHRLDGGLGDARARPDGGRGRDGGDRRGRRGRRPRRPRARADQPGHDAEPIGRQPGSVPDDQPDSVPDSEPVAVADAERLAEPTAVTAPTPTDDAGGVETPEPSESDHSGPGGGGDDNSGPGGGGSGSGG